MYKSILGIALLLGCSATLKTDMATVENAVVTCTKATCGGANPSPACVALEAQVLACLGTAGSSTPCVAAAQATVGVGYADLVCVLADLVTRSPQQSSILASAPATAKDAATRVLATQRIRIVEGAASRP